LFIVIWVPERDAPRLRQVHFARCRFNTKFGTAKYFPPQQFSYNKKIRTSSDAAGDERPRPSVGHLHEYAVFSCILFR
jgi:hypothetical protein